MLSQPRLAAAAAHCPFSAAPGVDTDFLDTLARQFLAGTNDLLAPELNGPDVGLVTSDVQAQLDSLAGPAAALEANPGGMPMVGYSFDSRSWPAAPIQAAPPHANAASQPQQLDKVAYSSCQPAIVHSVPQQLLQTDCQQPDTHRAGSGDSVTVPSQLPLRSGSESHSGSQEMERGDSPGPQLARDPRPDTASKGKVKPTHRTAQKRYRERQKERLLTAEAKVEQLTRQLQELKVAKDKEVREKSDAWWMDDATRTFLFKCMQLEGAAVLTVDKAAPLHFTCRELADMAPERVGELWRKYMSAFAECLLQWRGNPESPAGRRLDRLYFEALQMWTAVQVGYPDRVKEVLSHMTNKDATARRPQREAAADDEDWRLASAAKFTDEQRRTICALRIPHFVNIGRLRARRAALSARLQARAAVPLAQGVANFESIMEALKVTLRDEHCCYSRTSIMIWRQIFSFWQSALLNILAHPWGVRIWAIAELVAREAGELSSQELLDLGGQDPDAELLSLDVLPPSMRDVRIPPPDSGLSA